jgi:hypothetical protein
MENMMSKSPRIPYLLSQPSLEGLIGNLREKLIGQLKGEMGIDVPSDTIQDGKRFGIPYSRLVTAFNTARFDDLIGPDRKPASDADKERIAAIVRVPTGYVGPV